MKILFVIHGPRDPCTAIFRDASARAEGFRQLGHDAEVLSPNDFPLLLRIPSRAWALVYPFFIAFRLLKKRNEYQLVHFHSYSGWVFQVVKMLIKESPPSITAFQGLEPLYYQRLNEHTQRTGRRLSWRFRLLYGALMPRILRFACRRSDRVICLNQAELQFVEEHGWARKEQLILGDNYVSADLFIERRQYALAERIMFLGQWLEMKGTLTLCDAFETVVSSHPAVELWCVGTLADEQTVLNSFSPATRSNVRVLPRVDRLHLGECFRKADIFVLPTLSEGFNNALLEAMAAGLPIVTTPVGAAPDLLTTGESALFVTAADTNGLAAALKALINDADLRRRLGQEAQRRATYYVEAKAFLRFFEVIKGVVNNSGDLQGEPVIG